MLPETLRLADYGLGHDERAKEPQPVASVLGPRFYDWQLAQDVEESWEECRLHAALLERIVPRDLEEAESAVEAPPPPAPPSAMEPPPKDLFGVPLPRDVLGNFIYPTKKRGK